MLSLPKILALAAVVWLVFYLFRKMDNRRRNNGNMPNHHPHQNGPDKGNGGGAQPDSLDLEECKICGAWVAGQPCDREQCPYRG